MNKGRVLGRIQRRILTISIVLIVLVNTWYAMGVRFLSPGVQHVVGPAEVSVYLPTGGGALTDVLDSSHDFAKTGQRVAVYLRNDYCGRESEYGPSRITLLIVVIARLLWLLVGKLVPGEDPHRR